MPEAMEAKPRAADEYLNDFLEVVRKNDGFLHDKAENAYREVVGLVNDAIDYTGFDVKRAACREDYVKSATGFFLRHILQPFSYAIHSDMLTSNLPACFTELRVVLESLAKCYLADVRYPEQTFFQERLESLEKEKQQGKEVSTSKWMRELGGQLGLENRFVALWGKLSRDWVHTRGIVNRFVAQVVEKSDVPGWSLVIPMTYAQGDLDSLEELGRHISELRGLLKATMQAYHRLG
jgi:hypothetical protein